MSLDVFNQTFIFYFREMWFTIIYEDEFGSLQQKETERWDIEELTKMIKEISENWGSIITIFRC